MRQIKVIKASEKVNCKELPYTVKTNKPKLNLTNWLQDSLQAIAEKRQNEFNQVAKVLFN